MKDETKKKKRRRRFGDRSDGRRLRTIPPMTRAGNYLMPDRMAASNLCADTVSTDAIDKYIREKKEAGLREFSFMHVLLAAYVRTVSRLPALNRFIAGRELYAKNYIDIAITIKKEMKLESPDTVIKIFPEPDMVCEEIYTIMQDEITKYRNEPENEVDSMSRVLSHLPRFLMRAVVGLLKCLDYFRLLPNSLLRMSPFHCSMVLTSIGSLGVPVVYHHLYDFGNCPFFIAFGAKRHKYETDSDGNVKKNNFIDLRFTCDERICDGYCYAAAFRILKKYLKNPWLLDTRPEEIAEDID